MTSSGQIFEPTDKRWLADDTVLWRYVPLRTLFFYLNGLVFIPSIAKLRAGDPFEGEFYDDIAWFNTAFDDVYKNQAAEIDEWISSQLCSENERAYMRINRDYTNAAAEILRKHYFNFVRR